MATTSKAGTFLEDEEDQTPTLCQRVLQVFQAHILLILVLIVFALVGAAVFDAVESGHEKDAIKDLVLLREDTLEMLWKSAQSGNFTNEQWKDLASGAMSEVCSADRSTMQPIMDIGSSEPTWDFWTSLLFCGTVFTTIGYGTIVPMTTLGRCLCMLYATLGIPMCLLVLADLGQLLSLGVRKMVFGIYVCTKKTRFGQMVAYWCVKKSKRQQKMTVTDFSRVAKIVLSTGEVRKVMLSSGADNKFAKLARQARAKHIQSAGANNSNNKADNDSTSGITTPLAEGTGNTPKKKPRMAAIAKSVISMEAANKSKPDAKKPEEIVFVEEDFDPPPILTIFLMVVYILVSGALFTAWESWTYLESVYFVTVTLTTIGFGDFMPAHKKYFLALFIYLFLGLALVSMVINSLIVYGQKGVEELGNILDIDDDSDDEDEDKPKSITSA